MEKLKDVKHLSDQSSLPPPDATKDHFKSELKKVREKLFSLQNKFYVDGRFGLLIVLQGVDTAGKDVSIRHAFSSMNPMGIQVTSFKKPLGQVY